METTNFRNLPGNWLCKDYGQKIEITVRRNPVYPHNDIIEIEGLEKNNIVSENPVFMGDCYIKDRYRIIMFSDDKIGIKDEQTEIEKIFIRNNKK